MKNVASRLEELCKLPEEQRTDALRAWGDTEETLYELAEEAENLAVTELTRSLEATEVVLALADKLGGPRERSRARRARAQALSYADRFADALPLFEQASEMAQRAGLPIEVARARMSSIHPLASMGRYDDAVAAGEAAREAFIALGDRVLAARCDLNLGATLQRRGDAAGAMRMFDRARPLVENDPVVLAKLESNRGHALIGLDEFAAAERAYQTALPLFEQREMHFGAAIVRGNLAELATRQGRLHAAFHHFERARRHMEQDHSPVEVARLLAEQAEAQELMGLLDEARSGYEAAQPVLADQKLLLEAAKARAGLGRILLRGGELDAADAALSQAAREFAQLGHGVAGARVDLIRAELAGLRGQWAAAQTLATTALAAFGKQPALAAAARYHLARFAHGRGDAEAALRELDAGIAAAERLDLAPLLADLLHLRGQLRSAAGDVDGVTDLQLAVSCVERVRGALQAERFRAAFLGHRLAVYHDLVLALLGSGTRIKEAFQTVQRAKSRSLLDLVGGALESSAQRKGADDDPLAAEAAELRSELNIYYSRLADASLGEASGEAPERISDEIHTRERRLESIEGRLASASTATAGWFAPTADIDAIRERLPGSAALVEYFIAGDELIAFVVRREGAAVHRRLAGAADVTQRIDRAHFQIRRALRPGATAGPRGARLLYDCRRTLSGLHDALIANLATNLDGVERLYVAPHGPLHAVPFAALWSGKQYLVEWCESSVVPSGSFLRRRTSRSRTGDPSSHGQSHGQGGTWDSPAGGPAAAVIGISDDRTPQIRREVERVADCLRARLVITNESATLARVGEAMARADLVHLACHGHFSAANPMASGLKLADRWMTVRDIASLPLDAGLVTLSGCETGRSVIGAGDELLGLVRAFLAAGAGSVLVSLWTVHDESTAELMTTFYHRMHNIDRGDGRAKPGAEPRSAGATLAATLRHAQREAMERDPHPVHWAPFILVGDA